MEWLENKLRGHKVAKVIPDARTLEQSFRRSLELCALEAELKRALPEARRTARARTVPKNLRVRIAKMMAENPAISWDEALYRLLDEKRGS